MELEYFRQLARYNQWANRRLYAACARLPERAYLQPRPSFFGSIHATLNHILVGDRIWMGRFTGHESGIRALDQILYPEFAGLQVARQAEDAQIINFVDALDLPTLNSTLRYKRLTEPRDSMATPLRLTLGHFFNHQTHHRGQVHGLLSQTDVPPPPLDLLLWIREATPAA
ncbi:MAG: damage-inducible protein DinB [Alphaproteobacteria bacterium]|nr:damage-inducible protein DinB [Alphaproteobacteria bacterium]